jgi:gamma-glutamylcyclotransferase (GGCT)/AIG2-like uncharacterized protein YtfP
VRTPPTRAPLYLERAAPPHLAPGLSPHRTLHEAISLWYALPRLLVADLVFFYGTLMAGFDRRRRAGIDDKLTYIGRGSIQGALFDLGLYPAAVPAPDGHIWGEVYDMSDPATVLAALDEIEGYRPDDQDRSLYTRAQVEVVLPDGSRAQAWVYFYNAPLGRAPRIPSGDYLEHVKVR